MAKLQLSIDPAHSSVEFAVTFAMNAVVTGRFLEFGGDITLDPDEPQSASVTAWADVASLTTDHEQRDNDLRGDDFLAIDEHPRIQFQSDEVEIVSDGRWAVHGELDMRGRSRAVTLDTRYFGIVEDARGVTRAGFVAEANIDRSDWGITWNESQEDGALVSDQVRILLYISAIPAAENGDGDAGEDPPETGELEPDDEQE